LTFTILCAFAVAVGSLTVHRLRSDFDHQVSQTAASLPSHLNVFVDPITYHVVAIQPELSAVTAPEDHSVIRLLSLGGVVLAQSPRNAPNLGPANKQPTTVDGYRVVSLEGSVRFNGSGEAVGNIIIQYGQPLSSLDATVARVELLLFLGVLAGAGLALLAGIAIARRAMAPIAALTTSAEEIARTRDPSRTLPEPPAEDEVGELARTLQGMLRELDSAHAETEAMLRRQRQFVADASHELRTPLTSVLANLELLAEALHGEQGDAARSALRSSRRMRRLVADLLLLARTDVGRVVSREPVDLAQLAVEAAAELGPMSTSHELLLDVQPAVVRASPDELLRMTINLIENALRHTPAGTEIRISTRTSPGGEALLRVEDDGPGVPENLRATVFERFVRGAGDRGGSFGLGLAIVRAVAESHGGSVSVEHTHPPGPDGTPPHGARFTVALPATPAAREPEPSPTPAHRVPAA
jgi:two-component system, OmpR family, sensor kinase